MQYFAAILAQLFSVSVERPCPNETITFTCTVPGESVRWEPSDVTRITVRNIADIINEPLMPQPGYTVTLIAFNDTSLTSTLSRTAEDGITVSCIAVTPTITTIGSTTIDLIGELDYLLTSALVFVLHECFISSQFHQDHLPSCLTLLRAVQLMQLV